MELLNLPNDTFRIESLHVIVSFPHGSKPSIEALLYHQIAAPHHRPYAVRPHSFGSGIRGLTEDVIDIAFCVSQGA